jgi:hypothetical protein
MTLVSLIFVTLVSGNKSHTLPKILFYVGDLVIAPPTCKAQVSDLGSKFKRVEWL